MRIAGTTVPKWMMWVGVGIIVWAFFIR